MTGFRYIVIATLIALGSMVTIAAGVQQPTGLYAMAQEEKDGFDELDDTQSANKESQSEDDWFAEDSTTVTSKPEAVPAKEAEASEEAETGEVYPLTKIASATLILYIISWLLSKLKYIKVATHRKIWNVILLITFLMSGVLGLMLVVQINYDVLGKWFSSFMLLHVDFGIAMAIISIFHIFWHTKYFATYFKKSKKA